MTRLSFVIPERSRLFRFFGFFFLVRLLHSFDGTRPVQRTYSLELVIGVCGV